MVEEPKSAASSPEHVVHVMPYRSNALAIGEGIILLGGLAALDYAGLIDMKTWPVHPFLFVTVLMAAQYGIYGGIFAAMAAIVISYFDGWPVRPVDMSYFDFFRVAWAHPLTWIGSGIVIGIVASRQRNALATLTERLRRSQDAEKLIATQYEILAVRARKLERRLAGLTESGDRSGEPVDPEEPAGANSGKSVAPRKRRAFAEKSNVTDKNL